MVGFHLSGGVTLRWWGYSKVVGFDAACAPIGGGESIRAEARSTMLGTMWSHPPALTGARSYYYYYTDDARHDVVPPACAYRSP